MYQSVGKQDEFAEGVAKIVAVDGRRIGVILWRGEVYALRNICPHEYGPVCAGHAMPMIVPEDNPGEFGIDEERLVVICPWHGWEFEARTGRAAWGESNYKLKTYPAKVEGGEVLVDVEPLKSPAASVDAMT